MILLVGCLISSSALQIDGTLEIKADGRASESTRQSQARGHANIKNTEYITKLSLTLSQEGFCLILISNLTRVIFRGFLQIFGIWQRVIDNV